MAHWYGVVQPRSLDRSLIYPKELALLDIGSREVAAGNQVWVYTQMTGLRDIQPRLKRLLTEAGLRVAIMRSKSVKMRDRPAWIEKKGRRADVVISHPQLVQTGVDFFGKGQATHNLSSIVVYQTRYSLFTVRQASRRAWRIGQSKDCRVCYLHHAGTMQHRAMQVMARKMAAAMAPDGELSAEGLTAMADDESDAMAPARSISDAINTADIRRNWVKVRSTRKATASRLLPLGLADVQEEPIDGLDILAIEPHLIARTILECQEEVGDIPLSRGMLVRRCPRLTPGQRPFIR